MIVSQQLAEIAIGIFAALIAAGGWMAARYTRRHAHDRVKPAE